MISDLGKLVLADYKNYVRCGLVGNETVDLKANLRAEMKFKIPVRHRLAK